MSNLFNSYLKQTSNSEIAKNVLIVLMVVFAFYIIFENVISPLLGSQSDDGQINTEIPYDMMSDGADNELESNQVPMKLVDTSQLFWNEKPKRDPFSLHILKGKAGLIKPISTDTLTKYLKDTKHLTIGVKPKLTGIIKGVDSNYAIIDGKIMKIGDSIRGFSLESILNKSVKLKKHTKTITIRISDGEDNA